MIVELSKYKLFCTTGGTHDFSIKELGNSIDTKCLRCLTPFNRCYHGAKELRINFFSYFKNGLDVLK